MLIDSHCHLDYFQGEDLNGVLARAAAAGVGEMVTIGTRLSRSDEMRAIADAHPNVWCTVRTAGRRSVLFLMNLLSAPQDVEVRFKPSWSSRWLKTGRRRLPAMTVAAVVVPEAGRCTSAARPGCGSGTSRPH